MSTEIEREDWPLGKIQASVDLVKVVQEHVRLVKRNGDWIGLCPFHSINTKTFVVLPRPQAWYCLGCGRAGDVFRFVELIERTDWHGAVQSVLRRVK